MVYCRQIINIKSMTKKRTTNKSASQSKVVSSKTSISNPLQLKPLRVAILALIMAIFGVTLLAFTNAQDPSQVQLSIAKGQYDIPAGAIFVSPAGNNTNIGSIDKPLLTIRAAIDKVNQMPADPVNQFPGGGTIVVRGGVYHESLGTIAKNITIQPYSTNQPDSSEDVWLDGSDQVIGWVQDGTSWRKDGYDANSLCPARSGVLNPVWPTDYTCYDKDLINSVNPASYLPDMVFVDNVQHQQVLTRAEVRDGTFYVDRTAGKLYIGANPSGKKVEVATKKQAIMYYSSAVAGSKLRGIGIRRFAANVTFSSKPAMVEASNGARGVEFDKVTFLDSAGSGLSLGGSSSNRAPGFVVKNSTFANNGASGLSSNYVDGLLMENNVVYNNNTEKAQWEDANGSFGGVKLTRLTNSTIRGNLFQDNYGSGFWCDLDCNNNQIVNNMSRGNLVNGIYYEVSANAIIASNVSYNNGGSGFKASGQGLKIYNNTAYNNVADNYLAYDDPDRAASADVQLVNNISASGPKSTTSDHLIYAWMSKTIVGQTVKTLNNNLYFRPSATSPKYALGWVGTDTNGHYLTLDSAKQQTGREANGQAVDGKSISTLFKNADNGDFKLVTDSAAVNSGSPLPADVAAAVNYPASSPINIGALSWKNGGDNSTAVSTPDPVTPPPAPVNKVPTVSISLSKSSPLDTPASFTVTANASDADGSITKTNILQNGAVVFSCYNMFNCVYKANLSSTGTYTYSAQAYDDAVPAGVGAAGTKSMVVNSPVVTPPPTPPSTPPLTLAKPTYLTLESGWQLNRAPYNLKFYWAAVPKATSYIVTKNGTNAKTVTTTGYNDASVTPNTTSTYQVKAVNGASQSEAASIKLKLDCTAFWNAICVRSVVK